MRKLDQYLIDKTDRLMAWGQKHHGWNLAYIRFGAAIIASAANVASTRWGGWFIVQGIVWGGVVLFEQITFRRTRDYFENQRKTINLNAGVIGIREIRWMRLFMIFTILFFLPLDIHVLINGDISYIFSTIAISFFNVFQYITTAFYMGPGEFASEKNKKLATNMATSNT